MSWDAYFGGSGWNYTHNTNGMIEAVLGDRVKNTRSPFWADLGNTSMGEGAWWDLLDGLDAAAGYRLLCEVIEGLQADPERFKAMEPDNGWGSYDGLLEVLEEMRDACESDVKWSVNG